MLESLVKIFPNDKYIFKDRNLQDSMNLKALLGIYIFIFVIYIIYKILVDIIL